MNLVFGGPRFRAAVVDAPVHTAHPADCWLHLQQHRPFALSLSKG
jgi:hypothetical protein